jgi:CSLREA domain-containing protein
MRRFCVPLLAVGLATCAFGAHAATLTPTTTTDQFDLVADAECSLREAVESANLNADFGGCVAAGVYGDDVIELAAATYVLDVGPAEPSFGFDNSVGDLDVTPEGVERLDVLGQGAAVTVVERAAMADASRILDIDFLALVRLADLTVRNGLDDELGGGIYAGGFELTLERAVVRDNTVSGVEVAFGGGIFAETEVLVLVDSEVVDNRVELDDPEAFCFLGLAGGGIFALAGLAAEVPGIVGATTVGGAARAAATVPEESVLLVERTTIAGNQATSPSADCLGVGGGAYFVDLSAELAPGLVGSQRIVNSTFSGNSSDAGGGLVIEGSGCECELLGGPEALPGDRVRSFERVGRRSRAAAVTAEGVKRGEAASRAWRGGRR